MTDNFERNFKSLLRIMCMDPREHVSIARLQDRKTFCDPRLKDNMLNRFNILNLQPTHIRARAYYVRHICLLF